MVISSTRTITNTTVITLLLTFLLLNKDTNCCEQQRERAAQPSEEPQRGVKSLDGKVKRNHLNTPRYEYSDVYTHGDKTRSTQMDPSEWRCVCVENKEGYNGL